MSRENLIRMARRAGLAPIDPNTVVEINAPRPKRGRPTGAAPELFAIRAAKLRAKLQLLAPVPVRRKPQQSEMKKRIYEFQITPPTGT